MIGEELSEPPPGSIVRFSTGMYLYAAVRLAERTNLGLGFDGGANWQTTSSNDPEQANGYGIPKRATWQQILDFARGRRIEVGVRWEMIQEGFGGFNQSAQRARRVSLLASYNRASRVVVR